jgi:hypothetical protein
MKTKDSISLKNFIQNFKKPARNSFQGGGLILFETTHDAMKAEKHFRDAGIPIKLVAPPVNLRIGCDLGLEFDIMEKLYIERFIKEKNITFLAVEKLDKGSLRPVDLVDVTHFEKFTMVRAGNMKITFFPETGRIVNVSGGGCPDVPYLYHQMVGKTLQEAPSPADLGYTLCALMLNRAYEECLTMMEKK